MTADATLPASDDLTPEALARWEELAAKATEGPWERRLYDGVRDPKSRLVKVIEEPNEYGFDRVTSLADYLKGSDAEFIAAARTAIPALLSGVRSRDARIVELEAERSSTAEQVDWLLGQRASLLDRLSAAEDALRSIPGYTTIERFRGAVGELIDERHRFSEAVEAANTRITELEAELAAVHNMNGAQNQ